MAVPEATVHEQGGPQPGQHEVRPSRQIARLTAKPYSHLPENGRDAPLRSRVPTPYGAHRLTAFIRGQVVRATQPAIDAALTHHHFPFRSLRISEMVIGPHERNP